MKYHAQLKNVSVGSDYTRGFESDILRLCLIPDMSCPARSLTVTYITSDQKLFGNCGSPVR